jgi:hypothetical protein
MTDEKKLQQGQAHHGTFHLLSRLEQALREHVPASIAQKNAACFTLDEEPLPTEATRNVSLMVYPQNPMSAEPEVRTLPAEDVQKGLMNARVRVQDSRGIVVEPDANGNYLYWTDKPEFELVNAFYYATFTLRMLERYARRSIAWSFLSPRIIVDPHVGNLANAFYNEQANLLGFHTYKSNGKEISTAQNADIVSHETGHAVLDGMRDLWNESFGLGGRAIHESFGDMVAILVALHDNSLISRVLEWTKGDLRSNNFISQVAENLINAVKSGSSDPKEHTLYLRNALNVFKDMPFDKLSYVVADPEFTLSRQEHNYSRIFTGAFYDIFVGIYEYFKQTQAPTVALHRARSRMGRMLMMAVEAAPVGELNYSDFAKAFLTADKLSCDGEHQTLLLDVFANRNILNREEGQAHLKAQSELPNVTLPKVLNNSLSAANFLETSLLPALKWSVPDNIIPLNTYRNADGFVFMTFFYVHKLPLTGAEYREYNNAIIDVFGGLSFAFNKDNQLISAIQRMVNDEDIRQIRLSITDMITNNRIASRLYPLEDTPKPSPKGLFIRQTQVEQEAKLVKYPTIFDTLPAPWRGFGDYLQQLVQKFTE